MEHILFASDYPHWDGIFPHVVSTIQGREDISEDAKRKIPVNLPPLVPFGSRQWPTLITPGPGAKTLADVP